MVTIKALCLPVGRSIPQPALIGGRIHLAGDWPCRLERATDYVVMVGFRKGFAVSAFLIWSAYFCDTATWTNRAGNTVLRIRIDLGEELVVTFYNMDYENREYLHLQTPVTKDFEFETHPVSLRHRCSR